MRSLAFVLLVACGGSSTAAIPIAPAAASSSTVAPTSLPPPRAGSNVRVHVVGAHQVSETELAAVLQIDKPERSAGHSNRDVLERDVLLLQAELYDHGYVQAKVEQPSVAIGPDGVIDVTYTIEEGARFHLSKLDVEEKDERTGKLVTPLQNPKEAKVGEWFSRKALLHDVLSIQTAYRDVGYGNVDVVPESQIDPGARTIEIKIVIKRGPIVTFHAVRVDPPDALVAADTAKRNGVMAGARFSETNLERTKTELASKGFHVDVAIQEVRGKPDAVDVLIEVH